MNEPQLFNQQVSVPLPDSAASGSSGNIVGKPLIPQDQPLLLTSSITKVAHLPFSSSIRLPSQHASGQCCLHYPRVAAGCYRSSSPCCFATGFLTTRHSAHSRQPDRSAPLTQHSASTLTGTSSAYHCTGPVHVIPWDPSRPWGGSSRPSAQSSAALYSQGPLWGPAHLSLGVWGWGQQPAHQLVVCEASQRLRLI